MSFLCSICNKSYVYKNSLAAHKSRYHKRKEDSSNRVDGKDLSSAFGSVITPSRDVNRTRYRNNQDLSDEAENMEDIDNKRGFKRRRSVKKHLLIQIYQLRKIVMSTLKEFNVK